MVPHGERGSKPHQQRNGLVGYRYSWERLEQPSQQDPQSKKSMVNGQERRAIIQLKDGTTTEVDGFVCKDMFTPKLGYNLPVRVWFNIVDDDDRLLLAEYSHVSA